MNRGVVPFVLFLLVTTVLALAVGAIVVIGDHADVPTSLRLLLLFAPPLAAGLWDGRVQRCRYRRGFSPSPISWYVTWFSVGYIVMLLPALVLWNRVLDR